MKCKECNQELKPIPLSFDGLDLFRAEKMVYCDNLNCKMYRIVIVVLEVRDEQTRSNR